MMGPSPWNVCHSLTSGAFVLLLILSLNASYPLEEGAACDLKQEDVSGAGTCVVVRQCPPAVKSLKARRSHDFARCGFRGTLEVVCCPSDAIEAAQSSTSPPATTSAATTVGTKAEVRGPGMRRSVQACETLVELYDTPKVSYQISGGVNADPGEFPHMAALGYETDEERRIDYRCGGTLISDRFVLTAAHCIISQSGGPPVRVRMGMTDISGTDGEEVGVANITVHHGYQRKSRRNDIALIELERVVAFTSSLHPACLYTKPDDPKGLVITGWGLLEVAGNNSDVLQKGIVMPVAVSKCNESYMQIPQSSIVINQDQLCAVSSNGKTDACQGDSGGPIQMVGPTSNVHYVIGVTSFGRGCGGTVPGVYARVHSYIDWIEKIVWPNKS